MGYRIEAMASDIAGAQDANQNRVDYGDRQDQRDREVFCGLAHISKA